MQVNGNSLSCFVKVTQEFQKAVKARFYNPNLDESS